MLLLTLAFTCALATPPPFPEPEGPLPRAAFEVILRSGYRQRGGRLRRRKAEIELIVDAAPETG